MPVWTDVREDYSMAAIGRARFVFLARNHPKRASKADRLDTPTRCTQSACASAGGSFASGSSPVPGRNVYVMFKSMAAGGTDRTDRKLDTG